MLGWQFKTVLMFIYMTALLMLVGGIIGFFFNKGNWLYFSLIMLFISLAVCFYSYFRSKEMALKANHARIISRGEEPRLYDMVQELAERAGMPMPEVGIVESMLPNAFATGRNPANAAVVATRGILDLLPDNELRAVLAHEMSHVRNRDILVMGIASALAVVISFVARVTYFAAFFGSNRENRGVMMAIALAAQILVPIAALLIQLGISRSREFLADESGAKLINDPLALADALEHLERRTDTVVTSYTLEGQDIRTSPTASMMTDRNHAHMWIVNPLKKISLGRLFSTHPSTEERVKRLRALAKKMQQ